MELNYNAYLTTNLDFREQIIRTRINIQTLRKQKINKKINIYNTYL